MPSQPFGSFPASNSKNWNDVAKKELGGKDPNEVLMIEKHGLQIKPYYDASEIVSASNSWVRPSTDPYLGPRGWHNTPIVLVENEKEANKSALEHLANGADGIVYRLKETVDFEMLMKDIELPYCSSFFQIRHNQEKFVYDFNHWVNAKGFDKTQIVGGVFWDSPPSNNGKLLELFADWQKFYVIGIVVESHENATTEITSALLAGVNVLAGNEINNAEQAFKHLVFSFSIGPDFFIEIAKLKVFERLWRLVQSAYSMGEKAIPVQIHGLSTCWNNEKFQPNANMLKSTTSAISAVLGGCNFITIQPEDESRLKSRIARNVLTLLREESHLNQTSDSTAGSYYLESLIDQLSKNAWTQFQIQVK